MIEQTNRRQVLASSSDWPPGRHCRAQTTCNVTDDGNRLS